MHPLKGRIPVSAGTRATGLIRIEGSDIEKVLPNTGVAIRFVDAGRDVGASGTAKLAVALGFLLGLVGLETRGCWAEFPPHWGLCRPVRLGEGVVMSSRSRTMAAAHKALPRRSRNRGGLPSLSEKQTQAYLAARDVIRRILRTNTLVLPLPRGGGEGCDRTDFPARTSPLTGTGLRVETKPS